MASEDANCCSPWTCPHCNGSAFAPDGRRFKKKIWFLGATSTLSSSRSRLKSSKKLVDDEKKKIQSDSEFVSSTTSERNSFSIALRLDRNPHRPCLQLIFTGDPDASRMERKTAGYLLIEVGRPGCQPDGAKSPLVLRGFHISPDHRGAGLGKLMVRVFVELCKKIQISSECMEIETRKIDKPLLALILASVGFEPARKSVGVYVIKGLNHEENKGPPPLLLWSANPRQLRSVFSLSYLKTQNMRILDLEKYPTLESALSIEYYTAKNHDIKTVTTTKSKTTQCNDMAINQNLAFVNTTFTFRTDSEPLNPIEFELSGFCGVCFQDQIQRASLAWMERISLATTSVKSPSLATTSVDCEVPEY